MSGTLVRLDRVGLSVAEHRPGLLFRQQGDVWGILRVRRCCHLIDSTLLGDGPHLTCRLLGNSHPGTTTGSRVRVCGDRRCPRHLDVSTEVERLIETEPADELEGPAVLEHPDLDGHGLFAGLSDDLSHQLSADTLTTEAWHQAEVDDVQDFFTHTDEQAPDGGSVDADRHVIHAGITAAQFPFLRLRLHDHERPVLGQAPPELGELLFVGRGIQLEHELRVRGERRAGDDLAE